MKIKLLAMCLLGWIMPTAGFAAEGPHGGVIVGNADHQLELSLNVNQSSVDVYVIRGGRELPSTLGLTLLDPQGNRREYVLAALPDRTPPQQQFHAALSSNAQSSIGFEIRIPFRNKSPVTFKAKMSDAQREELRRR